MRKINKFLAASLLVASSMSANIALGANIPGSSGVFSTGFTIQNTSSATASCVYTFYTSGGSAQMTSATFSINPGAGAFTYVPSISGLPSGQYSGVVSCDQSVAAIVNHVSSTSAGSYSGTDSTKASTTWYSPNAQNGLYGGYYSNFVVQNTTANAVTVNISFYPPGSSTAAATQSATIAANGYANFDQKGLAGLSAGLLYSAKITASGAVAVEQNIYGEGPYAGQLYSFTPFTAGSTVAYAPAVSNKFSGNQWFTALTVQNIDSAAADVKVTYGNGAVKTATIQPSSSALFLHTDADSGIPAGGITTAKIESTNGKQIVALVNQANFKGRAASYAAASSGATKFNMPIATKRYYGYNSAVTCMNVSSSNANVSINYSNGASNSQSNVAANSLALFYQPGEAGLSDGFNGSATVSATQPVVCIGNQDQDENATSADFLLAYEGVSGN